jgi:hypothetical protein
MAAEGRVPVAPRRASALIELGRALAPAAHEPDVLDLLAVAIGVKPLASVATCYAGAGREVPAWERPDPTGPERAALGERLDAAGLDWRFDPVDSVREDGRTFTWYELLVGADGESLSAFVEATGSNPAARSDRAYGEALGYPASAVEWFVDCREKAARSAFDYLRESADHGEAALAVAASVPYVPAPTPRGARDVVIDGRTLVSGLAELDSAAGEEYAEGLLARRVAATLSDPEASRRPLRRVMGDGAAPSGSGLGAHDWQGRP